MRLLLLSVKVNKLWNGCIYLTRAVLTDRNTTYEPCMDGEVRLRDGPNPLEGRLEICINNAWGTVCRDEFTFNEARIVCAQLGFNEGTLMPLFCIL